MKLIESVSLRRATCYSHNDFGGKGSLGEAAEEASDEDVLYNCHCDVNFYTCWSAEWINTRHKKTYLIVMSLPLLNHISSSDTST